MFELFQTAMARGNFIIIIAVLLLKPSYAISKNTTLTVIHGVGARRAGGAHFNNSAGLDTRHRIENFTDAVSGVYAMICIVAGVGATSTKQLTILRRSRFVMNG